MLPNNSIVQFFRKGIFEKIRISKNRLLLKTRKRLLCVFTRSLLIAFFVFASVHTHVQAFILLFFRCHLSFALWLRSCVRKAFRTKPFPLRKLSHNNNAFARQNIAISAIIHTFFISTSQVALFLSFSQIFTPKSLFACKKHAIPLQFQQ